MVSTLNVGECVSFSLETLPLVEGETLEGAGEVVIYCKELRAFWLRLALKLVASL